LCEHERGEFFTFGYECPEFYTAISIAVGEIVDWEGFWPASLCPGDGKRCFLSVCYGKANLKSFSPARRMLEPVNNSE
jgi:hypothetical protein